MKSITNTLMATAFAVLAACSPSSDVTALGLQEVRRDVTASRMLFEETASTLVPSGITWANRVSVRYQIGADYRTESWEIAQVPATMKASLLGFMSTRNVEAIFVHEQRVNFVLHSAGIAPSGVSIGVVVAPGDEHGCTAVSAPLKLDGRGLLCEKLDGQAYLYLQR
jgi:hypothetical protein